MAAVVTPGTLVLTRGEQVAGVTLLPLALADRRDLERQKNLKISLSNFTL